jgi:hypothetical protein
MKASNQDKPLPSHIEALYHTPERFVASRFVRVEPLSSEDENLIGDIRSILELPGMKDAGRDALRDTVASLATQFISNPDIGIPNAKT